MKVPKLGTRSHWSSAGLLGELTQNLPAVSLWTLLVGKGIALGSRSGQLGSSSSHIPAAPAISRSSRMTHRRAGLASDSLPSLWTVVSSPARLHDLPRHLYHISSDVTVTHGTSHTRTSGPVFVYVGPSCECPTSTSILWRERYHCCGPKVLPSAFPIPPRVGSEIRSGTSQTLSHRFLIVLDEWRSGPPGYTCVNQIFLGPVRPVRGDGISRTAPAIRARRIRMLRSASV